MTAHFRENSQGVAVSNPALRNYETTAPASSGSANQTLYRQIGKRVLDITLVLIAAPVVLLVLLPMILMITLDGGRPFYTQMRIGQGGKSYRMWKLRSMVPDADAALRHYLEANPAAREEWNRDQKLKKDPRITKVGRVIRKTSLDELPQLWNVLVGDMSLVGPRPMMENQRDLYPGRDYYELRPGLTGPWQVSSRNESAFADRARFDTEYNQNLSLGLDLKLICATVGVVCKASGH